MKPTEQQRGTFRPGLYSPAEVETWRSERAEALAHLRDVTEIALSYVPKSIRDRHTFTANLSRAFLSRVKHDEAAR